MIDNLEPTLIAIIALITLGSAFLVVMCYAIDRAHCSMRETERLHWMALIGVIVICALMFTGSKPDPFITALDRALITEPPQPRRLFTINLADCPPQTDGTTDQLIMTISSRSDTAPEVTGCTRIAKRQYLTKGN